MSFEFLFETVFIFTFIVRALRANESLFIDGNNRTTLEPAKEINSTSTTSNIFVQKYEHVQDNVNQSELTKNIWNETGAPIFLNLIINLNFMSETEKKKKKHKKFHGRSKRELIVLPTTEKMVEALSKGPSSENLGNIFEKIKLKMELQRKKRNIEYQNNGDDKLGLQNVTNEKKNSKEDILNDRFPKMSLLNDDKELDVTRWLKNWKDILAVNPNLGTDKPTRPIAEYIDEWKYSYRVTLYNSAAYNVSNFVCSGILVSSQWVLTSGFCSLEDDITLLIGVHTLPRNISDHNRYGVLKKVYSLSENLELIQMDRPVQWNFKVPEIRAVKMEEMENLLRKGKCNLLSWIPVDIEKNIFELREYPELTLQSETRRRPNKNSLHVTPIQAYHASKKDAGSPVLCDGVVTAILLDAGEDDEGMIVELLCPVLEWITFFTREGSYFEVTARKFTMRSSGVEKPALPSVFLIALVVFWQCRQ